MAALEWQDAWSVGNETLDGDHKRLIGIINQLAEGGSAARDIGRVIGELEDYAKVHFTREEGLMDGAGIEGLVEHKQSHQAFIDWLDSVRQTYTISQAGRSVLKDTVNVYLQDWLTNHILKTDMSYKGKL